jgi:hypothetical protein
VNLANVTEIKSRLSFQQRIRSVAERCNLTISGVTVWMERPRATVNMWFNVRLERVPTGPMGREALKRLALLEWAADNDPRFPIPYKMLAQDRPAYVAGVRDDILEQHRVGRIRIPVVYPTV